MSGELTIAIRNGLKRSARKLVENEADLAKLEKQLDEAVIEENGEQRKLTQEEKDKFLDEIEGKAELTEDAGGIRQRRKTRGNTEDQLSSIGRNIPPLTPEEIQRVLKWQNFRNAFLKKWRDLDFSHHMQDLESKLDKARNSIKKNLTPDDLAAVIKEKRGEQILDANGIPYDHIDENEQAVRSIVNAIKSLRSQMSKNPLNYAEYEELLKDLNNIKDQVNKITTK